MASNSEYEQRQFWSKPNKNDWLKIDCGGFDWIITRWKYEEFLEYCKFLEEQEKRIWFNK